jgi:putative transposase
VKGSHKSRDPPGPGHVTRRSTYGSPPANHQKPEGLIGENGLPKQLTRLRVKKAPDAEMAGYPGYEKHEPTASAAGNARNGATTRSSRAGSANCPSRYCATAAAPSGRSWPPSSRPRRTGSDNQTLSLYARDSMVRVEATYPVIGIIMPGE